MTDASYNLTMSVGFAFDQPSLLAERCTERGAMKKKYRKKNEGLLAATPAAFCALMCCSAGRPKARVLPDPVAATPTRSCPERMIGQH